VFRVLLTPVVAFALIAHAQWGCTSCHSHLAPVPTACPHHLPFACADEHGDGHSHSDEPHPAHPCTPDCHCYFVLRLPTISTQDLDWPGVTRLVATTTDVVVVFPHEATSPASTDVGSLLSAARCAQHQVLLL